MGTNSIGWAITEQQDDSFALLDRGVEIFQEGVNRTKTGEEPMVKIRTDARAIRRHYYRRRLRKIELLKVLVANNLCPYLSNEQLKQIGDCYQLVPMPNPTSVLTRHAFMVNGMNESCADLAQRIRTEILKGKAKTTHSVAPAP